MASKVKVQKDKFGLYVFCGGWIARPLFGTSFKEGDLVKTHHFGGSPWGGVTVPDKPTTHNFRSNGVYEWWVTCGTSASQYDNGEITDEKLSADIAYYTNHCKHMAWFYEEENSKFKP